MNDITLPLLSTYQETVDESVLERHIVVLENSANLSHEWEWNEEAGLELSHPWHDHVIRSCDTGNPQILVTVWSVHVNTSQSSLDKKKHVYGLMCSN